MVGKHVRDVQREDSGMLSDVAGMAKLCLSTGMMVFAAGLRRGGCFFLFKISGI